MGNNRFGTIVQIGDILVSEDVVMEYFACDYAVCRGACCIAGDSGAPLEERELESLERDYPAYSGLMTPQGRAAVDAKGFFEVDRDNDIVTPLMAPEGEDAKDLPCAFCHFGAAGECLCAIEMAGKVKPAFEKGQREGIRVYQFLKNPLTKSFGEDFYAALSAAATHLLG